MDLENSGERKKNKKEIRKEAKKRKLQSLIDLTEGNEADQSAKKFKSSELCKSTNGDVTDTITDKGKDATEVDIVYLRAKKREMQRAKMDWPVFFISDVGHDAELNISTMNCDSSKPVLKLAIQDVQDLMMLATIGRKASYKTRWCKLMRYNKLSHSTVVVADGLSLGTLQQSIGSLPTISSLFPSGVVLYPQKAFGTNMNDLFNLQLSRSFQNKRLKDLQKQITEKCDIHESYKLLFPPIEDKIISSNSTKSSNNKCECTDLLLDPISMIKENYPFFENEAEIIRAGYKYTSKNYSKVTPSSPLFAVDCEMCCTAAHQSELTRISIIDEDLNVLYDKLVKPKTAITDYLTHFSGITEVMMQGVTTMLEDVQQDVQKLLPSDGILCGHSLNSDLHAMKMIHPYIIDTSVTYNTSGLRFKKPSLRSLASQYLGETIQNGSEGHNPVEDCSATMKLVLLNLQEGMGYGNVMMGNAVSNTPGENLHEKNKSNNPADKDVGTGNSTFTSDEPTSGVEEIKRMPQGFHESSAYINFFMHAQKESKKICVVGKPQLMEMLDYFKGTENVTAIAVDNNSDCVQRTREVVLENDLTFCHLDVDKCNDQMSSHALKKFDKRIHKLYRTCAVKSLFVLLLPGNETHNSTDDGFCMARIKE